MVDRDSFDYNEAIAKTWQEQMLLNMVRLRYGETPMFLDVASVISQYSAEGQLSFNSKPWNEPSIAVPKGTAAIRWIDRPTITYQPRRGGALAQTLLKPVALDSVFALMHANWPADLTLRLTVRSMNGVQAFSSVEVRRWNQDFVRILELIQSLRETRGSEVILHDDRLVYRLLDGPPAVAQLQQELRTLLKLDPQLSSYPLVTARTLPPGQELVLAPFSPMGILGVIAASFDVPEAHVEKGWTMPTLESPDPRHAYVPVRVHSGSEAPKDAFVATESRGAWFWIDEGDYASKRTFSFISLLLALMESNASSGPIVTVGAGS